MIVRWTDTAVRHLTAIHDTIAQDSPIYAQRMVDRLTRRSMQIAEQPKSGRSVPEYDDPRSGNSSRGHIESSTGSWRMASTAGGDAWRASSARDAGEVAVAGPLADAGWREAWPLRSWFWPRRPVRACRRADIVAATKRSRRHRPPLQTCRGRPSPAGRLLAKRMGAGVAASRPLVSCMSDGRPYGVACLAATLPRTASR